VFTAEFDGSEAAYGAAYDNAQDCSPWFGSYLDDLVKREV
jgi:hypothetical protein